MKKKKGILLIHGFTGSPHTMTWLAEEFEKRGFIISAPRLRGHGTKPADMLQFSHEDWIADAEIALIQLKKTCDEIYLVGLSLGGAISMYLSSRYNVRGVVTMAAPFCISLWTRIFVTLFHRVVPYQYKENGPDINDRTGLQWMNSYNSYPTRALIELFALLKKMRARIHKIDKPVLVLHGRDDHVVHVNNADLIYNALKTPVKSKKIYNDSYHILSLDYDKEQVFADIIRFIEATVEKVSVDQAVLQPV